MIDKINNYDENETKIDKIFDSKPKAVYFLVALWFSLSAMFLMWGGYSLSILINIPSWGAELPSTLVPIIFFGYTMSSIVWLVFSSIFIIIAYGTLRVDTWVWTTSMIISTIFLAIFSLMLISFMINIIFYLDEFAKVGLISTILTFLIDLGIIFFLTRPSIKLYFYVKKVK